jgi:hypothetical protein
LEGIRYRVSTICGLVRAAEDDVLGLWPGIGAVELKAARIMLDDLEVALNRGESLKRALAKAEPAPDASELFQGWRRVFGDRAVTASEVCGLGKDDLRQRDRAFTEALNAVCDSDGALNTIRLGKYLAKYEGQVVNGLVVCKKGSLSRAIRWKVSAVA